MEARCLVLLGRAATATASASAALPARRLAWRARARAPPPPPAAAATAAGMAAAVVALSPSLTHSGMCLHRRAPGGRGAVTVAAGAGTPGQEVEVKLRLPDAAAHAAVAAALGGPSARKATHHQENFFFDGPAKELSGERAVLRVRFYDTDRRALITLKGKQILVDGIGRGSEVEADAPDPAAARAWVADPSGLLALDLPLIRDGVASRFNVSSLVCLGGFENMRQEFPFAGHTLELDETRFAWGTLYEIEVESAEPEAVKAKLEALLKENGIPFSYSTTTKFHNFITGGKAEAKAAE